MSGNAMEEGLLLQLDNPSHLDSGRIAVPLGAVCGIAVFFLYGWFFDQRVEFLQTLLGLTMAFSIGTPTYLFIESWKKQDGLKNTN